MYLGAIPVRRCPSGHDGWNALGKSGQRCPLLNPRPDDMIINMYFNVLITATPNTQMMKMMKMMKMVKMMKMMKMIYILW